MNRRRWPDLRYQNKTCYSELVVVVPDLQSQVNVSGDGLRERGLGSFRSNRSLSLLQ
jgi:hypothetical protein